MIIGITGLIGSGKSSVGDYFHDAFGLDIVDCDDIAHDIMNANVDQIEEMVGKHRCPDNSFNRKSLLKYFIKNPAEIEYINDIIHPPVVDSVKKNVIRCKSKGWHLVFLVPLLFECHMEKMFDATIYVYTDYALRVKRLMEKRGLNKKQIDFFDNLQIPAEEKFLMCDHVLLNNGELNKMSKQIDELFYRIF